MPSRSTSCTSFHDLQGDDEVERFSLRMALDAEHGGDVDDADAAHFHVVARQFRAGADALRGRPPA